MISIVIRNKNEGTALKETLTILREVYAQDVSEIILVDNQSTDNSVEIATSFDCRVITIKNFSYGKASNIGIDTASHPYVLLLSAHAVPVGDSFFKNSILAVQKDPTIAGIRYINSFKNYQRAQAGNFKIVNGIEHGLMAACALINKEVWKQTKFNEQLMASEDKAWTQTVLDKGHTVIDLNETFFYFAKRDVNGGLKRWKIETLAYHKLSGKPFPRFGKILSSFLYKLIIKNPVAFFNVVKRDFKLLSTKLAVKKELRKNKDLN